jgi:hypothetical protein
MVETVFVNFIAAMLAVCCSECEVSTELGQGKLLNTYGNLKLSQLIYSQKRSLMFEVEKFQGMVIQLKYDTVVEKKVKTWAPSRTEVTMCDLKQG